MHEATRPKEREARLRSACAIAREAGAFAHARFRDPGALRIATKSGHGYDTVSDVDRAVERLLRERVAEAYPADRVIGEEGGADPGAADSCWLWVVDPIDGTDCFVNGIPVWSVSVAVVADGEIEVGVVFDPNADELFAMSRGGGAVLNGVPMAPSAATALSQGVVGIGISHRVSPGPTLEIMRRLLELGGMYQRNGSGALMLCYVAAGRLLGYYEAHINAWDALAGIGLVREAGGWTNDFLADDGLLVGNEVIACAPALVEPMRALCGASRRATA